MNKDILKYIFIDFVGFILFLIGVSPALLSFIFLPEIYYLNLIVGAVSFLLFFKFYSPWAVNVKQSLYITLSLDSSKEFSFIFYFIVITTLVICLIQKEYLLSGLLGIIILAGLYRVYKKRKKVKEPVVGDVIHTS